jgi:hypothetical protein
MFVVFMGPVPFSFSEFLLSFTSLHVIERFLGVQKDNVCLTYPDVFVFI